MLGSISWCSFWSLTLRKKVYLFSWQGLKWCGCGSSIFPVRCFKYMKAFTLSSQIFGKFVKSPCCGGWDPEYGLIPPGEITKMMIGRWMENPPWMSRCISYWTWVSCHVSRLASLMEWWGWSSCHHSAGQAVPWRSVRCTDSSFG